MLKSRPVSILLPVLVGSLALVAALVTLHRRAAEFSAQAERLSQLTKQNAELSARSQLLEQEIQILSGKLGSEAALAAELAARGGQKSKLPAGAIEAIRTVGQLKESLAAANAAVEQLKNRTAELESQLEKSAHQNRSNEARLAELTDKNQSLSGVVEAMQTELKGKSDRLVPLQMANKTLREENRAANDKISKITQIVDQLDDIHRRRDVYLTSILRRYNEITDQYRSLASRFDHRGEGSGPSGVEISRIQNSISMAEEDLRQINALNAQAERLLRRMRKK